MLSLILGGAAVHRCGNRIVLSKALAVEGMVVILRRDADRLWEALVSKAGVDGMRAPST
jgi:hydrogenase maturation factor